MGSRYEEIMATKPYLPYRMGYLTDWMVDKARDELNETDEIKAPALAELRELISKDTKLDVWTDDAYLLQYLRARKFNPKKAFNLFKNFYNVKHDYVEVYPYDLDVDGLRSIFTSGAAGSLPYRDENGCVVFIFKVAKWNPDVFPIKTALSAMTAIILAAVEDPATQVCGVHIFLDVKGTSFRQIRCITPRYIQLFSKALRNTLAVRFKGIHIFNESFIFTYLYNIIKIFLTDKIKKRFHFHGDNAKHLHKIIPKAILPAEYGGDNVNYNESEWCQREIELFYDRFTELHKKGYF
ncbi:alpha-tocopherol transfer protein-like [Parasteatoda tepidariorum]|uniref:alpha-tocopherol transfer protein-like n=1 Tax=Parasteatoda tepidariorum TaxID=114398 RepID=UPI00077FE13B|nr:alpha-tocopherol transfer protein-like [Parasteatoda tepidariorum]XP_015904155.1 alpha-tocopherol transfer protein-like [Parasteatoda tepidariorum]XP_015904158.1 alpha-tocopherol transfer protein-like [Parasteatoda tepidariorum]XP_015904159.1 alpha-tocopherol transfer protein-like [Parasteatoda tepidariorum]XP_042906228.1 alpha-tocopherol transfer protein-like [Parasteatoda tepidariorum]